VKNDHPMVGREEEDFVNPYDLLSRRVRTSDHLAVARRDGP
jgi:hypothetical protein